MTKHTGNNNVRDTSTAHGSAGGKPGGLTPNQGDFFGDIHAIYEAVSKLYPGARSRLLEPYRDNPVDVLVATILSQAPTTPLAAVRFQNSSLAFPTGIA